MSCPWKWIITRDFLAEDEERTQGTTGRVKSAVGKCGPRNCDDRTADQLPDTFRMFDDDNNLYFEGKTDCLSNEKSEGGFEPLDDYGMPDSGCTSIQYLNKDGVWETL